METMDEIALVLAVGIAAVCGAATGRAFALEGENRRTSILAAAYCGAGAGLLSAPLVAFPVVLIATVLHPQTGIAAAFLSAGEAAGSALLWGVAGGATGGLAVGIVVSLFKRYSPR
jgi:hypothetical protein